MAPREDCVRASKWRDRLFCTSVCREFKWDQFTVHGTITMPVDKGPPTKLEANTLTIVVTLGSYRKLITWLSPLLTHTGNSQNRVYTVKVFNPALNWSGHLVILGPMCIYVRTPTINEKWLAHFFRFIKIHLIQYKPQDCQLLVTTCN